MPKFSFPNLTPPFSYFKWVIFGLVGWILLASILIEAFVILGRANNSWAANIFAAPTIVKIIDNGSDPATISSNEMINSFGDNFSGIGFIDRNQTDMYLDYDVTAFSFPPVYDLKEEPTTTQRIAPMSSNNLCLGQGAGKNCVTVRGGFLYVNNVKVAWPAELQKENILSVKVAILSNAQESRWIIGVVTGQNSDERGWVYFFNSRDFTPLITAATTAVIEPKFGRKGGIIYFGGTLDDFLIFYSGYDGHAFYDHGGILTDVSEFFGLRVTAGGFPAQILRTANARGSVFYICSQDSAKLTLIKVWSRRPGELVGALDFSYLLSDPKKTETGCSLTTGSEAKVLLGFTRTTETSTITGGVATSTSGVATSTSGVATSIDNWSFTDKGFDNSQNRQVTSLNLEETKKSNILAASFSQIEAVTDDLNSVNDSGNSGNTNNVSASNTMLKLYLANKPNNWQEVSPYNWYEFNSPAPAIYWRAVFQSEPKDANYSPWFNNVDELLYKTAE